MYSGSIQLRFMMPPPPLSLFVKGIPGTKGTKGDRGPKGEVTSTYTLYSLSLLAVVDTCINVRIYMYIII